MNARQPAEGPENVSESVSPAARRSAEAAMTGTVLVLSGPNLNLLGERQPEIYGKETLDHHVAAARRAGEVHGLVVEHFQSNSESALVDAVQGARGRCRAIVVNAAAFTHYAWALGDALATFDGVVVELHLSNPNAREPWRHTSVVAPVADGVIAGFGGLGYELAILAVARLLERQGT